MSKKKAVSFGGFGRAHARRIKTLEGHPGDWRLNCGKVATEMVRAFDWETSPEGHAFWASICDRLTEMADSE